MTVGRVLRQTERGRGSYQVDMRCVGGASFLRRDMMKLRTMLAAIVMAWAICVSRAAWAEENQPAPKQDDGGFNLRVVWPPQPGEKFESVTMGNVKVYYMEGWKEAAEKFAAKADESVKSSLALIGVAELGTCEFTMRPIKLAEGEVPGGAQTTDLNKKVMSYPFPVPEGGEKDFSVDTLDIKRFILWAAMYTCVMDMQLAQADALASNPKWFVEGLSSCVQMKLAATLAGADSTKLISMEYSDKILEHYREKLLNWNQLTQHDWAYGAGCMQMFMEIEKKYGAEAILKIGQGFVKAEKADRETLVKVINEATGGDLADFLTKYEAPKYPQLGVGTDSTFKGPWLLVTGTMPNSAAADAGFAAGDIMLKGNGKDLNSAADLQALVKELGVGGVLKVTVKRGETEVEVTATIREPKFNFPPDPEPAKPAGEQVPPDVG